MLLAPKPRRALVAFAAALATAATPVAALDLPRPAAPAAPALGSGGMDAGVGGEEYHRRYRHRNRNRGGNVLAGILVLGGVAAIAASAANRERNQPVRRYPADLPRGPRGEQDRSGLSRAVDMCVEAVERGRGSGGERVTQVDSANRDPRGWLVTGETAAGEVFTCRIGNDGRIDQLDLGAASPYRAGYDPDASEDRQYDDAVYARLRDAQGNADLYSGPYRDPDADPYAGPAGYDAPDYDESGYDERGYDEPRPAYPGGPLPGEEGYDDYMAQDRY